MQNLLPAFSRSQETLQVILLILITAASLFVLCGLSFMFGTKRHKHKSEFLKFWFLIPLWIAFLAVCIRLGQIITITILPRSTDYPFSFQLMSVAWGILGIGVLAELRQFVPIPETDFFYSYLLTLLGLLNIELFSAFYLPFVVLMSIEALIIYLSRTSRHPAAIIFFIFLMLVPFVPNAFPQFRSRIPYMFSTAALTPGWISSFLLSCLVLPFLLQCVRYLIGRGLWHRMKGNYLRNILTGVLTRFFICALIMIAATLFITFNPLPDTYRSDDTHDASPVICHYQVTDEYGISNHRIMISANEELSRCDISVQLSDDAAVLFSDLEYTMDSNSVVHFTIENPDSVTLECSFSTSMTPPGIITVTALDDRFYPMPVECIQ